MSRIARRPRFLNLMHIRLPVGAITSIAHRGSGVLLFLCLPLAAFMLDVSLRGPEGFERAAQLLTTTPLRALGVIFAWSLAHHMLAGIRFLLIDLGLGVDKPTARCSALAVNVAAPVIALLCLWRCW
ncbi:MAG: succinate dehydrogenase, cytochrome b556 subunit [Gammaproteobacteria bacterium]